MTPRSPEAVDYETVEAHLTEAESYIVECIAEVGSNYDGVVPDTQQLAIWLTRALGMVRDTRNCVFGENESEAAE